MEVTYGVLGPLEVRADNLLLPAPRPREARALAVLLLDANRAVSVDRLAAVLWDGAPPPTADAQIRNVMTALRHDLGRAIQEPAPIRRTAAGFALSVRPGQLDLDAFQGHTERARLLLATGEPAAAADALRQGLALWRGPTLGGIGGTVLEAEVYRLDELRLAGIEQRIELDLSLGRHRDVVGELATLVAEHPLRERFIELRMIALDRCGRRQDALDAFAAARACLREHAGLDPRPELLAIQQQILTGAPFADAGVGPWPAADGQRAARGKAAGGAGMAPVFPLRIHGGGSGARPEHRTAERELRRENERLRRELARVRTALTSISEFAVAAAPPDCPLGIEPLGMEWERRSAGLSPRAAAAAPRWAPTAGPDGLAP